MSSTDMKAANQTYHRFIGMIKWAVPLLALLTLFIIFIIAPS